MTMLPPGLPALRPRGVAGRLLWRARVPFRRGPRRAVDEGERPRPYWPAGVGPRPFRHRIELRHCREILVVKLDYLGDWVLTTPFLAALRQAAPRARITVAVLERTFELAVSSRDADRVVSVEGSASGRLKVGAARLADASGFRCDYAEGRFDLAIVPRWDIDFNGALQLAFGSGAPVLTYAERSTPGRARINRGDDRFVALPLVDPVPRHDAEHSLRLLAAIGGDPAPRPGGLVISAEDRRRGEAFLAAAFTPRRPLIALSTRATAARRSLPPERAAAIGRLLRDRFDADLVIVGGAADRAETESIARAIGPRAVSSIGRVSMRQSLAVIGAAALMVAVDSGPAHMAAALGVPVAVISSHHRGGSRAHAQSPHRFAPWGDAARILVVQPEAPVPPCGEACGSERPHCILGVTDELLAATLLPFAERFLEPVRTEPVA
jgi:heptosyltransferase-2